MQRYMKLIRLLLQHAQQKQTVEPSVPPEIPGYTVEQMRWPTEAEFNYWMESTRGDTTSPRRPPIKPHVGKPLDYMKHQTLTAAIRLADAPLEQYAEEVQGFSPTLLGSLN